MAPELCHNSFHCRLVFLQEYAELFVFLEEDLIFDDDMSIHPLQFGFEGLYIIIRTLHKKKSVAGL